MCAGTHDTAGGNLVASGNLISKHREAVHSIVKYWQGDASPLEKKGSLNLYIHTDAVITFVNKKKCALILNLGELQLGPTQTRESIMSKD
jgi:hypothetical protein